MFCPRRAWLEAVGERVDSAQMSQGTYDHRKVDCIAGADDSDDYRAVNVRHEVWGVAGRLDAAGQQADAEFEAGNCRPL